MSSSSDHLERWKNQEYTNYLKVLEGLLFIRDGVGPFCDKIISDFQSEILMKYSIEQKKCTTKTCSAKNIKKGKLNPECPKICSLMLKDILDQHVSAKSPDGVYWANCQVSKWPTDAWEIAKAYMGRGQRADNNGPQKSDSAAIFQLLSKCKRFSNYVPPKDVNDLSAIRNSVMHCTSLSLVSKETEKHLNQMISFLNGLIQKLSAKNIKTESLSEAVGKLTELLKTDLEIFLKNNKMSAQEEETKILKEIMDDHQTRLLNLEEQTDKLKEVKAVVPLLAMLDNNPDLMTSLEDGFHNLLSLSKLDLKTKSLTDIVENTTIRLTDVEEDVVELQKKLEALSEASSNKNRSNVVNYKGKLKDFLDSKKVATPPKYKPWPDPAMTNNWMASVTVMLGSEPKTFESQASFKRMVDAEHSASLEAFQFLNDHPELFTAPDGGLTATDNPIVKLDELLQSFGFQKANYLDINDKFDGTAKSFVSSVTVYVSGIIQKKLDGSLKKADMQQAVAEEALSLLGEQVSVNSLNSLYQWCGKQKSKPEYSNKLPREDANYQYAHVISSAFSEKYEIKFEGLWCKSKKEARQSAAALLLKFFFENSLLDIWRSKYQSNNQVPVLSIPAEARNEQSSVKADKGLMKNVPLSSESLSYCRHLENLCQKLKLEAPQFKMIAKENHFQANITMSYNFGPDSKVMFKSKTDAESEAAKVALEVLIGSSNISDVQKKPFKSQLNEFCQKQKLDSKPQPQYLTDGSDGSFSSKVQVKFIASFPEILNTESEAREFSAKKVLQMLGQYENHFNTLKRKCAELGLESPKVTYKDVDSMVLAVVDMTYIFTSETCYPNKKEAEKNTACHILKILYPKVECSDMNKCKNRLQEQTPSVQVKYDTEQVENSQFKCKVTVAFETESDSLHKERDDALDQAAEKILKKLCIS